MKNNEVTKKLNKMVRAKKVRKAIKKSIEDAEKIADKMKAARENTDTYGGTNQPKGEKNAR
jgi:hypothetical protein